MEKMNLVVKSVQLGGIAMEQQNLFATSVCQEVLQIKMVQFHVPTAINILGQKEKKAV